MKTLFATCLLLSLLLTFSLFQATSAAAATADIGVPAAADSGFCGLKCKARCATAGMPDRCIKYCGICCLACKCVPSGTYGNKDECPCYRDKLSSKGKPKCP